MLLALPLPMSRASAWHGDVDTTLFAKQMET
jgi:hypothetical protein